MRTEPIAAEKIRALEGEVRLLRHTVISLMPDPCREVLETYTLCADRQAVWSWMRDATLRIIDLAERRPAAEMGQHFGTGDRSVCPLCGEGARGPLPPKGFAWPEGLRRHLLGEHNSQQCRVMAVVQSAAIDFCTSRHR